MSASVSTKLCALIVVRAGVLPAGGAETFGVCGAALLVGTGTEAAAAQLVGSGTVDLVELPGELSLRRCADAVAEYARDDQRHFVTPSSSDGRDLAPRLAALLDRPLLAGAVRILVDAGFDGRHSEGTRVELSRAGGWVLEQYRIDHPAVVTLIPGLTGVAVASKGHEQPTVRSVAAGPSTSSNGSGDVLPSGSVRSLEVLPPDPSTMDLTEAARIVAGGQGLKGVGAFEQLARIGRALGASLGGTRVASDAGWLPFERQIGTTGVMVSPKVYIAFGISGATQHTSGLGAPELVISVNTDASCPMMKMADVAIVSDAIGVLNALERQLATGPVSARVAS